MEDKVFEVTREEVENSNPSYKVTSSKTKVTYTIKKTTDGFVFFEIVQDSGSVPSILSGRFTKPEKALEQLEQYLVSVKPSKTVKRDENTKAREKRKDAKAATQSNDKEHVQQGLAN